MAGSQSLRSEERYWRCGVIIKTVEGAASVVDGDTVVVNGITVRLKGVDAPEPYMPGGPEATAAMRLIVRGWLRCDLTGEKTFKREVGYCYTAEGYDIGEAIISGGKALSCPRYCDVYRPFEQPSAQQRQPRASYCISGGQSPNPTSPAPQQQAECLIKGNINSKGEHIYHMPEQRYYNVTVIDPTKGERMFCTEKEALDAGWRKSKI
jgi:endonuclease YncB( thermonuclease family)